MKTFNKNSLIFKIRAWSIVFLGIIELLHFIVMLFVANDSQMIREIWFWIIFTVAFTFWQIKDEFSIGRLDGLVVQGVDFVITILYLFSLFSISKTLVIAILEIIIFLLGIFVIYRKNIIIKK